MYYNYIIGQLKIIQKTTGVDVNHFLANQSL